MFSKIFVFFAESVRRCQQAACLPVFLVLSFFVLAGVGVAETRHHESHVHGIGKLNVALDGNTLVVELDTPAANIVGFEHAPHNEEQAHALHEAMERLREGEKLFALPAKAKCRLKESHLENDTLQGHHEEHDSHEHGEREAHVHEHRAEGEAEHSDIEAIYHFECAHPEHLESMDVLLFSLFAGFEELEVQLITPKKQTAVELTPQKHLLSL